MRQGQPNIIMVITHDTGRRLGCYGASVSTPHLDRLAEQGIRFSHSFCTAPQCSPSRGSMLTGRFPHENGLMGLAHLGWRLHPEERCLPQYLSDAGYQTVLCGLQHEDTDARRLGYQSLLGTRRDAASVGQDVATWLKERSSQESRPFFLMVGMNETHRPFDRPAYHPDDPIVERVPSYLPDIAAVRQELAEFGGLVRAVDEAVDRIMVTLDEVGLAEQTLLIYTTDHGIAFPRAKGMAYDPGLETALLVRWSAHVPQGQVDDHLLSHVDLLPTLLELAGQKVPGHIRGRSFLALLTRGAYEPQQHVFFEETWHDRYNPLRGIRTDRYKYIRSFDPESPEVYIPADIDRSPSGAAVREAYYARARAAEEFYDLQADPGETRNLVHDPSLSEIIQDLRRRVLGWMESTGDPLLQGAVKPPLIQADRLATDVREGRWYRPLTTIEQRLIDEVMDRP